ncbi:MAG: MFS transporter [Candidatus Micrarchaeaceae archaeon]
MESKSWLTRNILLISFSAFFADLGYQAVVAAIPVFLVIVLHAPAWAFGLTMAISYGFGAFLGYIGGRLSDRYGRKKIAIIGNSIIPVLSLTGLASTFSEAAALFSTGWLFRNFRSPARRAMISEETNSKNKGRVFGFLNALDVGGGVVSVVMLIALVLAGISIRSIFLITIIPLVISTLLLANVKERRKRLLPQSNASSASTKSIISGRTYKGVIIATALYGFSYYSLGFPILTIAQTSGIDTLGFASYALFLATSAVFGYIIGTRKYRLIASLAFLGYILSAFGTMGIGLSYTFNLGIVPMFISVFVIGMALGAIDTLEPTIISYTKSAAQQGRGMGSLTSARSIGILVGNLSMGLLYALNPLYSYSYASIVSLLAGLILLYFGRGFLRRI